MEPNSTTSTQDWHVDPHDEGARDRLITPEEFRAILSRAEPQREMFSLFEFLPRDSNRWKKRHCSVVLEKARELETFLDDYHARNNRGFVYFAELNASVRNFASVAHTLNHLDVRFAAYDVRFGRTDEEHRDGMWDFRRDLSRAIGFANESMVRLLVALREEAITLGLSVPEFKPLGGHVPEDRAHQQLPHDLDAEEVNTSGGAIAVLLNRFLQLADRCRTLEAALPRQGGEAQLRFVTERFDETLARTFRASVHNLQSAYDTYVKPTRLHAEVADLRRFRGHVSLALHLLEVGNELVHFYERHESKELRGATKERIAAFVDREQVLHFTVQFALRHALGVIASAQPLVQALLPRFVQQHSIELDVPQDGILHARPLSLIVKIVRRHAVPVEMVIDRDATSAGSLMGLILFIGKHPNARRVAFRGDRRPLDDLQRLFSSGLGEQGLDRLPPELAYLRED